MKIQPENYKLDFESNDISRSFLSLHEISASENFNYQTDTASRPMVLSKTPFRLSFFGGGTDLPEWSSEFGGKVLSTTINKYCYISCRELLPLYNYKHRLVYSKSEQVNRFADIKHRGMRGVLEYLNPKHGLEIHHDGDLPARSGLGSSSSFTVGLLNALNGFYNNRVGKEQLAKEAIFIEQNINNEVVGSQDQVAASFGGFNRITFNKDGSFFISELPITNSRKEFLNQHLLLFYTGIQRLASDIEETKISGIKKNKNNYFELLQLVEAAEEILLAENFDVKEFGNLLHTSWQLKRSLSEKVTNNKIDEIYTAALKAGAVGGKLLGAGGGGFFVFFIEPRNRKKLINTLQPLTPVDFKFENDGTKLFKLS